MAESAQGANRSIEQVLASITARLEAGKKAKQDELTGQGYPPEKVRALQAELATDADNSPSKRRQPYRGKSANRIIEQAQLSLFDGEQRGQYTKFPLNPSSEFPSMLARLPIFVPGRRSTQRHLIDKENAMPFETPWGKGRKHGPPLTVHDEDTLMVLGMLRQDRLSGAGAKFPISVSDILGQGGNTNVHVLFTTLSEVEQRFGNAKNGQMFKARLQSIKRLASTRIEFEAISDKAIGTGTVVSLLDVAWERWEQEAVLYIQFSPVMAHWYENAYSYLDWNVRMSLSDTGKAIHRFLSSQPRDYEIYADKLRRTIGYPRDSKYFARDMRESLKRMQDLGWLTDFRVEGTGRAKPHKLIVSRQ